MSKRLGLFWVLVAVLFGMKPVWAGEGALALTTEPQDAEIRVDGELKAMSTPVVLKLPEGKHQLEATAGDKSASLEVFIPADGVISKKLTLEGSAPVVVASSPIDYYRPERDSFETEGEFAARKDRLREQIDAAVDARKKAFIAGTATLDKAGYDIKSGEFPVTIKWEEWAKALSLPRQAAVIADRDMARQLWQEGQSKSIFVDGNLNEWLIGLDQSFSVYSGEGEIQAVKRYQIHDDGTVTDRVTGLQWMRCAVGQTWTGTTCSAKAKEMKWEEAKQQTARFAGDSDWRTPAIEELRTLVYCSTGQPDYFQSGGEDHDSCDGDYQRPTIDQRAFPNTPTAGFWSSSAYANYSSYAWHVSFSNGYDSYGSRSNGGAVRLVRGGQ